MNYCSAAFGIIALVAVVTWVVDGRKNFTGPQTPDVVTAIEAKEGHGIIAGEKKASPIDGSIEDSSDETAAPRV
jgi:indole-3-glycerol phosphate synthase